MDMEKKKLCAPIAEAMKKYREDGALAFHTPGHKQGLGAHPLLQELITEKGLREEVSLMEELEHTFITCDVGQPRPEISLRDAVQGAYSPLLSFKRIG